MTMYKINKLQGYVSTAQGLQPIFYNNYQWRIIKILNHYVLH